MNHQEHIFAVVEPTEEGEATLDLARQVVARGGKATLAIILTRQATDDMRAFSESENLGFGQGSAIFTDRLSATYSSRVGGDTVTMIAAEDDAGRELLHAAGRANATTIAIPQRLMVQRAWRIPLGRSTVPVVIAPRRAA